MAKPIIGVVPLVDYKQESYWMLPDYLESLELWGAVPVMLPLVSDEPTVSRLLDACSGLLFTGGQDVVPESYGEKILECCGETCPERDAMESRLLSRAMERKMPIFGICRGIQSINTTLGGTLFQDIAVQHPGPIQHRMERPYDRAAHTVTLLPGTPLAKLLGGAVTLEVNSCHHQAIHALAPGLEPMATTPDGLIEAVFMPGYPFLWAVQWHPERLYKKFPEESRIFKAFVGACEAYEGSTSPQ